MASVNFEPALRRLAAQAVESLGLQNARVAEALAGVPRHLFLDEALRARAYDDDALPIGYGQTISRISTVARMTEALDPAPADRVLEVGTGSGYQAAVLARLAGEVYSIERIRALAVRAQKALQRLGIYGVEIRAGDGALGWPEAAPFHGILVAAAAREVPRALLEQMAIGGKLVVPVGEGDEQRLRRIIREADESWSDEILKPCRFVPLVEARPKPAGR